MSTITIPAIALATAEALADQPDDEPIAVMNADLLVAADDVRRILDAFYAAGGDTLALLVDDLPSGEDAESWIGVGVEGDRVTAIIGRSGSAKTRLSGLAIVPARMIPSLRRIERGTRERRYLASVWAQEVANGSTVIAVKPAERVVHVDRCFDYLEANMVARERMMRAITTASGVYTYVGGEGDPDPRYIWPGTIITPGKRLVFEEGSFIGPFDTCEAHERALAKGAAFRMNPAGHEAGAMIDIRIRGNVHLGPRSRIGLNALVEGDLVMGAECYVEDAVIEPEVLLGERVRVRRGAIVRRGSVCGDGSRYEAAADFAGVAGPGTVYMHPGQCQIVTGRKCDLGAGNWVGTWRFDGEAARFAIGGRLVRPRNAGLANVAFLGDDVRTGIMVCFAPGTRVGADTIVGMGIAASRDLEPGSYYRLNQDIERLPVTHVRPRRTE